MGIKRYWVLIFSTVSRLMTSKCFQVSTTEKGKEFRIILNTSSLVRICPPFFTEDEKLRR